MADFLQPKNMEMLKRVSLGEEKADLVISGGDLVNVYSGELLKNYSVAVKGSWIAYLGPDADHTVGPDTEVIDASGKVVIPGFVDGHAHMILYARPDEVLRYAMMGGTTTIITEIMELIYPLGYSGLVEWLDNLQEQPVKVFATVPPSISFSKDAQKRAPGVGELIELLRREEVLGVGEGFWQEVLRGDTNFSALSGASYPVFCYLEYDSKATHYTAVARALVKIVKDENWFRRTKLFWLGAAIILGVILVALQFKRKGS